jgi:hypothetical protein
MSLPLKTGGSDIPGGSKMSICPAEGVAVSVAAYNECVCGYFDRAVSDGRDSFSAQVAGVESPIARGDRLMPPVHAGPAKS